MQKFPRLGFRRNTHSRDGKFKSDSNVWQAHIWNRSDAAFVGHRLSSKKAFSFKEIVKLCNDESEKTKGAPYLDEEEIAFALVIMLECKLVELEQIEDYETDAYDDGVKFWSKK
jgi:hypothetical protein